MIRLGIRAQLQRFHRAQAGGGFNQQLPAERIGAQTGEHQFGDAVQFIRVVGHEFPAMADILVRAIARTINRHGVAANQLLAARPKERIAQGCQLHVHCAIPGIALHDVFLPPLVIPVARGQRHRINRNVLPEF
jgi:hypothetical protein